GLHITKTSEDCWLDVDRETARSYLGRLEQQQSEEALSVERLKARLANKSYVDNAPKELIEETKSQLAVSEDRLSNITAELDNFKVATETL
ncbi:MAG: hypothetical protein M3Q14_00645, partial [bacterium]|nr:hypothetical protein [bacterium]